MYKNYNKSSIFGTKIQIRNSVIFSENWIFGHNLTFSNIVHILFGNKNNILFITDTEVLLIITDTSEIRQWKITIIVGLWIAYNPWIKITLTVAVIPSVVVIMEVVAAKKIVRLKLVFKWYRRKVNTWYKMDLALVIIVVSRSKRQSIQRPITFCIGAIPRTIWVFIITVIQDITKSQRPGLSKITMTVHLTGKIPWKIPWKSHENFLENPLKNPLKIIPWNFFLKKSLKKSLEKNPLENVFFFFFIYQMYLTGTAYKGLITPTILRQQGWSKTLKIIAEETLWREIWFCGTAILVAIAPVPTATVVLTATATASLEPHRGLTFTNAPLVHHLHGLRGQDLVQPEKVMGWYEGSARAEQKLTARPCRGHAKIAVKGEAVTLPQKVTACLNSLNTEART